MHINDKSAAQDMNKSNLLIVTLTLTNFISNPNLLRQERLKDIPMQFQTKVESK